MQLCLKRRNFAQYFNKQSLGFVLSAQSYCGGESLVGMLSAVGKQVLWRRIMADETWEAQVFGKNKTSNPQPIGFRGNLLVKRQKFFYCTYSLGITETS